MGMRMDNPVSMPVFVGVDVGMNMRVSVRVFDWSGHEMPRPCEKGGREGNYCPLFYCSHSGKSRRARNSRMTARCW